jgi:hypothetical protein
MAERAHEGGCLCVSVAMIERSYGNLFPKRMEGGVKHLAADDPRRKW